MSSVANFAILFLSLTTITFFILFWIYYNGIDSYMKDKETILINKERDLNKREAMISACEANAKKLQVCSENIEKVKTIVN